MLTSPSLLTSPQSGQGEAWADTASGALLINCLGYESENDNFYIQDDILLYMTSYGAGVFFKASGKELYTGDALYFEKQMNRGTVARKFKHFFFITVWSVFYCKKSK